jgi:hypothetical protein
MLVIETKEERGLVCLIKAAPLTFKKTDYAQKVALQPVMLSVQSRHNIYTDAGR